MPVIKKKAEPKITTFKTIDKQLEDIKQAFS